MVVEQALDGNYTGGDGGEGEEASSSDLEQSSGSILPDDQVRVSRAPGLELCRFLKIRKIVNCDSLCLFVK